MMKGALPGRRLTGLLALMGLLLAVFAGFGFQSMQAARRQLDQSFEDLQEARSLVADIQRLRQQPRVASLEVEPPSQIAVRVSAALQAAEIPTASLIRVDPQPAVRQGRSPYQLRATQIELQEVSLEQVIRFAHHLGDERQGMTVRDLFLSEPRTESASGEVWDAEVTLTQMIFSPTIP